MQNIDKGREIDSFLLTHNCNYHNLQEDICDHNKKNKNSFCIYYNQSRVTINKNNFGITQNKFCFSIQ